MYLKSLIFMRLSFPNIENLITKSPDSDLTGRLIFSDLDKCIFLGRFKSILRCFTLVSVDNIDNTKLGMILSKFLLLRNLCFINVSGIPSEFWDARETRLNLIVIRRQVYKFLVVKLSCCRITNLYPRKKLWSKFFEKNRAND